LHDLPRYENRCIRCSALLSMMHIIVPWYQTCVRFHRTNYGVHEPLNGVMRRFNELIGLFDFSFDQGTVCKIGLVESFYPSVLSNDIIIFSSHSSETKLDRLKSIGKDKKIKFGSSIKKKNY
jgi:hypothetical protein